MSAQVNYNTEAICENVDTLTLCEILGIPVKKKGATYFSECPNPEHHEEKIFSHNKIYPGNGGCHCFACGKTYRPYGMAKDWLEKQGQIVSGSEIYGILGDAAGGREQYIVNGRFKPEEKFPLNKKLMDILDFKTSTGFNEIKSCETDENGMILSSKEQYAAGPSVKQLWLSDKTAFWYIVGTRCRQMLEKYRKFANVFSKSRTASGQAIAGVYKNNALEIKEFMLAVQSKI